MPGFVVVSLPSMARSKSTLVSSVPPQSEIPPHYPIRQSLSPAISVAIIAFPSLGSSATARRRRDATAGAQLTTNLWRLIRGDEDAVPAIPLDCSCSPAQSRTARLLICSRSAAPCPVSRPIVWVFGRRPSPSGHRATSATRPISPGKESRNPRVSLRGET